jgi:D-Tyr-tRNA(Tyr) deacylase
MSTSASSVHLVLQRYRKCKILLNETEWVTQGWTAKEGTENCATLSENFEGVTEEQHCGLLIYISFATNADSLSCINAAETCLNMPILTSGLWGDGTSQQFSIKSHLSQANPIGRKNTSVTIVPQANLICKIKGQGTSIQYHSQIDKDKGRELYNLFVDFMTAAVFEYQCITTGKEMPDWFQEWRAQMHQLTKDPSLSQSFNPSIEPADMFRSMDPPMYGSFDDETGIPLSDLLDVPLSKSSLKKLRKLQDLHQKRHQKWLQQQIHSEASNESQVDDSNLSNAEDAIPSIEPKSIPPFVWW